MTVLIFQIVWFESTFITLAFCANSETLNQFIKVHDFLYFFTDIQWKIRIDKAAAAQNALNKLPLEIKEFVQNGITVRKFPWHFFATNGH